MNVLIIYVLILLAFFLIHTSEAFDFRMLNDYSKLQNDKALCFFSWRNYKYSVNIRYVLHLAKRVILRQHKYFIYHTHRAQLQPCWTCLVLSLRERQTERETERQRDHDSYLQHYLTQ